jgi:hypothetical protein
MAVAAAMGLGRPRLWPLGLASFLLRGGFVLYLVPIVVVPSTVGVATWVGPTAITPGGPSERFTGIVVAFVLFAVAWFVGGGLIAAAAEASLIRQVGDVDGNPEVDGWSRARLPSASGSASGCSSSASSPRYRSSSSSPGGSGGS